MSADCIIDEEDIEYFDEIEYFYRDQDVPEISEDIFDISSGSSTLTNDDTMDSEANEKKNSTGSSRIALTARVKKKKHRLVPGKHTSVTKNDFRRSIPQMYFDALNSGSVPVFRKTVNDFATPDCVVVTRNMSSTGMLLPSVSETYGVEARCLLYEAFIKSSPDFTFELHSSSIRVFSDGTSSIICKYSLFATKVFAVAGLDNSIQKVVLSLDPIEDLSKRFGRAQLNADVTTTVDDPVTGSQTEVQTKVKVSLGEVLKDKSKVAVCGTIKFLVNTDKRVYHMDSVMSNLNEQRDRERLLQQQQLMCVDVNGSMSSSGSSIDKEGFGTP